MWMATHVSPMWRRTHLKQYYFLTKSSNDSKPESSFFSLSHLTFLPHSPDSFF